MKVFELHIVGNERQYHIREYLPVVSISRRTYSVLYVPIDDSKPLESVAECENWQEVATAVLNHQASIYKGVLDNMSARMLEAALKNKAGEKADG